MNLSLKRFLVFVFITAIFLPVLAGCGKNDKAMQAPDGLSNRDKRDKAQGLPAGT